MHKRYTKKEIKKIWSDEKKLALWQKTELAVIEARVRAGEVPEEAFHTIQLALGKNGAITKKYNLTAQFINLNCGGFSFSSV
jgi:adenylosuccinate lyase